MTSLAATTSSTGSRNPTRLPVPSLAIALAVQILAVFSAATNGFHHWIELRFTFNRAQLPADALPGIWAWAQGSSPNLPSLHFLAWPMSLLMWAWVASVLLHFWLLPTGIALSAAARRVRRRLLLPSVGIIVVLIVNSIYYCRLYALDRLDSWQTPITFYAAVLLIAWIVAMRRTETRLSEARPSGNVPPGSTWLRRLCLSVYTALLLAAAMWFFGFAFADSPPPASSMCPRVAVVFGNLVKPTDLPGQIMGDRVLTAIELYRAGEVQFILLSGACAGQDGMGRNEPIAMKKLCLLNNIPESVLYLDPVGINTRASVESTRQFLQHFPSMDVVAVSSPSHLPRVRVAYAQAGISVYTVAAVPTVWGCEDLFGVFRELYAREVYSFDPAYRPAPGVAMAITHPRLVVTKSANTVELYDGARLAKTYKCITGKNPGDKEIEGDKKTPLGTFHIVYKNPESKFHLSMGLDYPNEEDCRRGVEAGLIKQEDVAKILEAAKSDLRIEANQKALWKSPLGGEIFIHGHGEGRDDTAGCVALSNLEIEELYAICDVGTEVEIRP